MSQLFTKDFLKFLLGFLAVILVSVLLIVYVQSVEEGGDTSDMRTLPATTTSR